jgi:hypothetical protein
MGAKESSMRAVVLSYGLWRSILDELKGRKTDDGILEYIEAQVEGCPPAVADALKFSDALVHRVATDPRNTVAALAEETAFTIARLKLHIIRNG